MKLLINILRGASRKKLLTISFSLFILLGVFGCWLLFPQPDSKLWPPATQDPKLAIYVVLSKNHTFLTFPEFQFGMFQEWHMGSRNWYEHPVRTWQGRLDALWPPSEGVIRFGLFPFAAWERAIAEETKVFKFWLSQKGYSAMLSFLHRYRGAKLYRINSFWYFKYKCSYHLLTNCNGFTAAALKAAGLPVREAFALERSTMNYQLERCLAFQSEKFQQPFRPQIYKSDKPGSITARAVKP